MDNKTESVKLDWLYTIFTVNEQLCISVVMFAKLFHYDRRTIWKWIQKDKLKAFKYKRFWYIILPPMSPAKRFDTVVMETPSGRAKEINWQSELIDSPKLPPPVVDFLKKIDKNLVLINQGGKKYAAPTTKGTATATWWVGAKSPSLQKDLKKSRFNSTLDYRYGFYIIYDPDKMSTFNPGTGGTLVSTTLPSAFFELCRVLNAAENSRNGANPGLPAKQNLSVTISLDTGTVAVAGTFAITQVINASGVPTIVASDYLGSSYSAFVDGGGDLNSTTLPAAMLELGGLLAAAEKAVLPTQDQPNNVQVLYDLEAGNATISANLPFTTLAASSGNVEIQAIDYL